jgi:hypothetical protein
MLKEPRRDESLDQSAHRLEQVLRQYADRIPPFLQNYRDRQSVEFRRPVDAGDASLHPFFKAVSNVASRASAKIAIDEKGRYEPPLDVVISQHPRNCCVHQLLAAMGFDHREAWVSHAHGEKSLIWFQLARFAFGFSLPAVDNYEPYVEARKRYICQSRFTLDDLALDTAWARYYRVLCNNCERELTPVSRDGEATDGAPPRPGSESPAGARLVDRLHVAADVLFSNLNERWKGHGNFASPSGAADCLSMIAETQVAIRHLFDTAGGDGAETLPSKQLLNEVVAQAEGLRAGLNNVDADFTVAVDSLFSDFTHSLS